MNRRRLLSAAAITATAALSVGLLSACGAGAGASSDPKDKLIVGASAVPHAEILEYVRDNLAAGAGLELDVQVFDDYVLPNTAVDTGEINANFFQHQPYLDEFNKENGTSLVGVKAVHVEPLGAYSQKLTELASLPDGATIAFPDDATNGGRALKLLADNGLITLKDGVGTAATEKDVVGNPKNLEFQPLAAEQLPRSLEDVDVAIINGNYALQADLNPARDALAIEKAEGNPYANLLVTKSGQENDERITKLATLLTSPEVKKFIEDKYQGSVIPAF
ncbi:MetQ/NlpA family ABC transporter substrate-binding protein [Phytomonospora endophytica]|uniref:Lipoprotein n=1 Tax=Phytomonospora endophytica TaxID=714109 RepID=A0A841FMS1_9ACTN|nr:MetQ/NlpA family ABC transporter substrate-binding protein [Phytomonospora endophytica]MBB6034852.1 D-methionine transport system substrate-binding protein [Phytomonospora endophytica]GIG68944.1 lipoprotein [Phytomonospora endophytica]